MHYTYMHTHARTHMTYTYMHTLSNPCKHSAQPQAPPTHTDVDARAASGERLELSKVDCQQVLR